MYPDVQAIKIGTIKWIPSYCRVTATFQQNNSSPIIIEVYPGDSGFKSDTNLLSSYFTNSDEEKCPMNNEVEFVDES